MLRVAQILDESVVDGSGIRVVVFFQGCCHNCKGCHNPALLPVQGGTFYSVEKLGELILQELTCLHRGVTFSGGDPLLQVEELTELVVYLRKQRPALNIWVYTGYRYEEIADWPILQGIDILVDGRYEDEKRDLLLRFRGSSNQRIIDVPASLAVGKVVEHDLPE